ncbi:hypothetical protein KF728_26955 [Candidatus Obscuribacterales bacterium]|nr:hypothetical protein [Candidatus Obscuribacterales bacterium]
MSRQYNDNFESGLGSGRTSFVNPNGAMMVSATSRYTGPSQLHNIQFNGFAPCLVAGGEEVPVPEENSPKSDRSEAFTRWPFMKSRDQESLHDRISDKVMDLMDQATLNELNAQMVAYESAFKAWTLAMDSMTPPELDDYSLIKAHNNSVTNVERLIVQAVFADLTKEESVRLDRECDPQGPSFAPKQMTDEVVRRIREQTRVYLNCTEKVSYASTTGL